MSTVVLSLLFLALLSQGTTQGNSDTKEKRSEGTTRLLRALFENYDPQVIPDGAHVKFGAALISTKLVWIDSRLKWNESEFANVGVLHVNPSKIWIPDIRLYNSANSAAGGVLVSCEETKVLIYPNGEILWVPPCHFKSNCKNTLKKSPDDPQTCVFKFASWSYDGFRLAMGLYNDKTFLDLSDFEDITNWKILNVAGQLNEKYYPCCMEPWFDVSFNVTLQRKSSSTGLETSLLVLERFKA